MNMEEDIIRTPVHETHGSRGGNNDYICSLCDECHDLSNECEDVYDDGRHLVRKMKLVTAKSDPGPSLTHTFYLKTIKMKLLW
jgi:hypothetical protein